MPARVRGCRPLAAQAIIAMPAKAAARSTRWRADSVGGIIGRFYGAVPTRSRDLAVAAFGAGRRRLFVLGFAIVL